MSVSVTVNGTTYTSPTDFAGTLYVTALINMLNDLLADVTQALTTTSATSESIGTGSKTFTMAAQVPFGVGAFVVIADTAAPTTNYMYGQVTARTGTSLTVNVTSAAGSGTKTAWTISVSGAQGAAGTLSGNAAGAIDMNGFAITLDAVTLSGAVAGADQEVARIKLKDYAETRVQANTGTSYDIDLEAGNVHELTLTGNCTFTFSNPPASGTMGSFFLILKQDATGSRTTTWPASVDWPGGSAASLSTGANDVDLLMFWTVDGGTTWYGQLVGADFQ
jgi:hypothetical protein